MNINLNGKIVRCIPFLCKFLIILMVSDKTIQKAFRINKTLFKYNPIENFSSFTIYPNYTLTSTHWIYGLIVDSTMEPRYNEVLGTMKITLLYQGKNTQKYKELVPAKLPCYKRVLFYPTSL